MNSDICPQIDCLWVLCPSGLDADMYSSCVTASGGLFAGVGNACTYLTHVLVQLCRFVCAAVRLHQHTAVAAQSLGASSAVTDV